MVYNFRPPGVTTNRRMGPRDRFLSNYFDLLFHESTDGPAPRKKTDREEDIRYGYFVSLR